MKEVIIVIGTIIGIMTTFWMLLSRQTQKIIENQIRKHKEEDKAHFIYIEKPELNLVYEKLLCKLEVMNKELVNLREEFHIFKEKMLTKLEM